MTYGDAKTLVKNFLLGDNSNATVTDLIAQQSLYEIATICEPLSLIGDYTQTQPSDFFRVLDKYQDDKNVTHTRYIRKPVAGADTDQIDLDIDLHTAFVFMCCSYLSFKQKDYYTMKATGIISLYKSNHSTVLNDTY